MHAMFFDATSFNQNINTWNVLQVTDMTNMFRNAVSFNEYIGNWKTSSVTAMEFMFHNALSFSKDVSTWDDSNAQTDMMFFLAPAFTEKFSCSNRDSGPPSSCSPMASVDAVTIEVENPYESLTDATFLGALRSCFCEFDIWDQANSNRVCLEDSNTKAPEVLWYHNFYNNGGEGWAQFNEADINAECITFEWSQYEEWPKGISSLETDDENYDFARRHIVYHKRYGFISDWDVGAVTNMAGAFKNRGLSSFSVLDLRKWDVTNVEDMSDMFLNARFGNVLFGDDWEVERVADMSGMFQNVSITDTLTNFQNWNVRNVVNMDRMFYNAPLGFSGEGLGDWDVSSVRSAEYMFAGALAFNENLSNWDTSSLRNARGMFYAAYGFNSDLSAWNVANIQDAAYMFAHASKYSGYLSSWALPPSSNTVEMFQGAAAFNAAYTCMTETSGPPQTCVPRVL